MWSVRKQVIYLKRFLEHVPASLAAMLLFSPPFIQAAENPAKALQERFDAARASLAAGDLASAESHYADAVTLGLRLMVKQSMFLRMTQKLRWMRPEFGSAREKSARRGRC